MIHTKKEQNMEIPSIDKTMSLLWYNIETFNPYSSIKDNFPFIVHYHHSKYAVLQYIVLIVHVCYV